MITWKRVGGAIEGGGGGGGEGPMVRSALRAVRAVRGWCAARLFRCAVAMRWTAAASALGASVGGQSRSSEMISCDGSAAIAANVAGAAGRASVIARCPC